MEPINYTFGSADPYKMAMQGWQSGLDANAQRSNMAAQAQGMQLAQNQDGRAQQSAGQQQILFGQQQAQLAKQAQAREDLANLTALGSNATAEDYAAFLGAHPEIADEAAHAWTAHSTAQQDSMLKFGAQVYTAIQGGNLDAAKALLKEHQLAAENSGNKQDADLTKGLLMQLDLHPEAAATALRLFGDASTGGAFSKMVDAANGPVAGSGVQSSQILEDGTIIALMDNGATRVTDPTGAVVTGQAAADTIAKANAAAAANRQQNSFGSQTGRNAAQVATGGEAAQVVAQGAAIGTTLGQSAAQAGIEYPAALDKANTALAQIKAVRDDKSLPIVTGSIAGNLPNKAFFLSQKATDLLIKMEQLKGQTFLQAYTQLRGAGAITEQEGQAATNAIARLNRAASPEAYKEALDELSTIIERGAEILKQRAAGASQIAGQTLRTVDQLTDEEKKKLAPVVQRTNGLPFSQWSEADKQVLRDLGMIK